MCGIVSGVLPEEMDMRQLLYVAALPNGHTKPEEIVGVMELSTSVARKSSDLVHAEMPWHMTMENRGQDGVGVVMNGSMQVFDASYRLAGSRQIVVFKPETTREISLQTRYRTIGAPSDRMEAMQPVVLSSKGLRVSFVHNGNSIGYEDIHRRNFAQDPDPDRTDSHTIAGIFFSQLEEIREKTPFREAVYDALRKLSDEVSGAYLVSAIVEGYFAGEYVKATVSLNSDSGIRPNAVGYDGRIVASESRPLRKNGLDTGQYIRPGEALIHIHTTDEVYERQIASSYGTHPCLLEDVYIQRNSSRHYGETKTVGDKRYALAIELGIFMSQAHPDALSGASFIVGVPKGGDVFADGLSDVTGIPKLGVLKKNKYAQRSYISPDLQETLKILEEKFNIDMNDLMLMWGQKIILIDDSIIKGSTMIKVLELLGLFACEVVVLSSSPKFRYEDGKGVLIPTEHLLARDSGGGLRTHMQMTEALGPHCSKLIFPPLRVHTGVIPNMHARAIHGT